MPSHSEGISRVSRLDFTTSVPVPVVTVVPNFFDVDALWAARTTAVLINITNWGLIAAKDVSLQLPQSDRVRTSRVALQRTAYARALTP
jgi:hypothetical protein